MKKIFTVLFLLLTFVPFCQAQETNLTFLYINGSNNNDEKMRNWYLKGVNKLHPVIKRKFEHNSAIKKWSSDNKLIINENPRIFFWGYDSKTDLDFVKERIDISKAYSSAIAYEVRSLITQFMHDAIWVQKDHNMLPILDELNAQVINLANEDQHVLLYGYSAGTFVTYQYLIYKLPYINLNTFFADLNADEDLIKFIEENPRKNTCLSALTHDKSHIGVLSNSGEFVLNQNPKELKQNYLDIDAATDKFCAPENRVKGVVNFASPLPLFYSDSGDDNYKFNYFSYRMLKYVMENGLYFLTVNFREDPLGFPSNNNVTIPQMEERLEVKLDNPSGVIYDNSKVWSMRSAFLAHTSYWSARGKFASSIVKTFVNGTKFLYDEKYQQKVIKRKKDPELLYD